jgi:hypothetical protein
MIALELKPNFIQDFLPLLRDTNGEAKSEEFGKFILHTSFM